MATSRRLLALLLVPLGLGFAGNVTNDICAQKAQPGFKLNLTATMIFTDHILMIDSHFMVYKVPKANYEDSYGSLVLNISGVYIEDFWPVLKGNKDWERVKPLYKRVYHVINNKGDFFLEMVPPGGVMGLCYNVKTRKSCPELYYKGNIYEQMYIDAAHYAFSVALVNRLPILRTWTFHFTSDEANTLYESDTIDSGRVYYAVETKNPTNRNVTIIKGTEYMVTPENDPLKKTPGFEGYHLENVTDWHLDPDYPPVGYLYKGTFHLYVFDKVIIFADAMPSYAKQESEAFKAYPDGSIIASTKLKVVGLTEFFKCKGDRSLSIAPPTFPPKLSPHPIRISKSSKDVNRWLIIGIVVTVLAILLAIACGVYFCCFTDEAGKHRSHGGNHKKDKKDHKDKKHRGQSKQKLTESRHGGSLKARSLGTSKLSHGTSKQSHGGFSEAFSPKKTLKKR